MRGGASAVNSKTSVPRVATVQPTGRPVQRLVALTQNSLLASTEAGSVTAPKPASSSVIVAFADPSPIVAFDGSDNARVKLWLPSTSVSPRTATSIVLVDSPGANSILPSGESSQASGKGTGGGRGRDRIIGTSRPSRRSPYRRR